MPDREDGAVEGGMARVGRGWLMVLAAFFAVSFLAPGTPAPAANRSAKDKSPDYARLFEDLAVYLKRYYLDLDRVSPRPLVEKAFAALENAADEIYVENSDPSNPSLTVHVYSTGTRPGDKPESKTQTFNLDSVKTLDDAVRVLENVFDFIKRNYTGDTQLNEIRYAAANGFLGGLDPHTLVFSPDDFKDFSVHIEGEICGVGMYVGSRDGKLTVIEVLKNTPALKAGFHKGDLIAKIGDESTINMTVQEAVEKIRGACDSAVTLTVKRADAADPEKLEPLDITVRREKVVIKSVESALIRDWNKDGAGPWKGGVGYVQVVNFDKNTVPSLREHLAFLETKNGQALAGLILDLRGNSGGLLTQAVEMSDLFLKSGDIVITASRGGGLETRDAEDDENEPTYPIVVLSNEASASGAEIVIGALQKNDRAIVLGTRTFGKGSVQQLHPLKYDAQLKITVSEYLIPGKISIQENGVVPDIMALPVIDDGDIDLFANERSVAEKNYDTHIISRFARKETPKHTLHYLLLPTEGDPNSDRFMSGDLEPTKDKLVQIALDVLKLAPKPFKARDVLEKRAADVKKIRADLDTAIVDHLKEKGIDWTADPSGSASATDASHLDLELASEVIQEPSKEKDDPVPVRKLLLRAKLTNKSDTPIYRMKGITHSEYLAYKDHEFLFGKVGANETVERTAKVRLPYYPYSRNDVIEVEVSSTGDLPDGDEPPADRVAIKKRLQIEQMDTGRPAFAYSAELLDGKDRSPVSSLTDGMEAILQVKVRNTGKATAHKGIAILRNETGRQVFLKNGRIEFTELAPGAEKEVEFGFDVRSGDPVDAYKFEIVAADSYSAASISQKVEVPRRGKETAGPFPNGIQFSPPLIVASVVDPVTKKPVVLTDKDKLDLEATIESSDPNRFKAWVMNSVVSDHDVPPDKIYFAESDGAKRLTIATQVPLKKGINLFTVVSNGKNGLESRQNIVVRRE